ncbi:carbonic anhydrase [Chachezhania sediminis]|uniref:carbonic anhydrase n=1 Tax=Chachezhania sediminis TaxID=2599291 RepID=UPI00131E49AE|nr:carbonic anhydrase [Chachezhania sediminis]
MCEKSPPTSMDRRNLFKGGLALALAGATVSQARAQTAAAAPASPQEALQRLIDGNARYVANATVNGDHSADRIARSQGQSPFAGIVTCSDSRVVPELIFDQGPGDLFVVRVAGNFINDDGLASLEYAVAVLGIQTIMVLGHSACGAVDATIKSIQDAELPPGHLPHLVNAIRPAVYDVMPEKPADLLAAATRRNATLNAGFAAGAGPILAEAHAAGKIGTAAGFYDIATGSVTVL